MVQKEEQKFSQFLILKTTGKDYILYTQMNQMKNDMVRIYASS